MREAVHVRAPCRLHFGMFSFGRIDWPQFGGVGVVVEPPKVEVTIRPAERFSTRGDHSERARQFAEVAGRNWQLASLPNCEIEVRSPPDHTGLGVGTQLGLAIAAGLRRFLHLLEMPVEELASSVGRGQRSAVGTYGFDRGGMIVDAGKSPDGQHSRLARRVAVPPSWRFVLLRPPDMRGLAGDREVEAFARLPPVPAGVTEQLWQITNNEMLPAVDASDCAAFGHAVYRFGRIAGECFAAVQGGSFASPQIAELATSIRESGVPGVGQSSWGPTVFAIAADDEEANRLVHWLHSRDASRRCEISIAQPNNAGAAFGP